METVNLEKALASSKFLMKNDYSLIFREYSVTYFSTTEFISSYLDNESYNKNRALTVLASGDHVFSLASKGIQEIDAFDINKLAYYVYYLKLAMLRKLPYQTFIKVCVEFNYWTSHDEIIAIIDSLKNNMPEDVYEYFKKIFEWQEKETGSLSNLFYDAYYDKLEIANPYLHSEEEYLDCRKRMADTNVNLYFGDARKIPQTVCGPYDIILLSNIADYFGKNNIPLRLDDFKAYIDSYYNLLNQGGLLINYLYGIRFKHIICDSFVTMEDLGLENIVPCSDDILEEQGYYRVRK